MHVVFVLGITSVASTINNRINRTCTLRSLQSVVDQYIMFHKCGDTLESHAGVGVKNTILTAVKHPFCIVGYFSDMRHLTTLQALYLPFWTLFRLSTQDFRLFEKTLLFDQLEVKFA